MLDLKKYLPKGVKVDKIENENTDGYLLTLPELEKTNEFHDYLVLSPKKNGNIILSDDCNICETLAQKGLIPSDTDDRMDWYDDLKWFIHRNDFEADCWDNMEDENSSFEIYANIDLDDLKDAISDYLALYNQLTKPVLE